MEKINLTLILSFLPIIAVFEMNQPLIYFYRLSNK